MEGQLGKGKGDVVQDASHLLFAGQKLAHHYFSSVKPMLGRI